MRIWTLNIIFDLSLSLSLSLSHGWNDSTGKLLGTSRIPLMRTLSSHINGGSYHKFN